MNRLEQLVEQPDAIKLGGITRELLVVAVMAQKYLGLTAAITTCDCELHTAQADLCASLAVLLEQVEGKGSYTAGEAYEGENGWECGVINNGDELGWALGYSRQHAEAIAKLLAAAPELREVVRMLLADDPYIPNAVIVDYARAALAKADGTNEAEAIRGK